MHQLDNLTATQLAAGATLDRPAAVIRELIDNAIDAGARHIQIHVGDQGRMEVRDDGCGMTASELPLAFTRHTTSKITCYADLVGLQSLGFRGEALASIAAVARVTCVSRTTDAPHAYELRIAGGEVHDIRPCAGAVGTQITVERLFYTTPHRRNFWRQPYSEAQHIGDIVSRYALCYPGIAFHYESGNHEPLMTSGSGDIMQAISELWHDGEVTPVYTQLTGMDATLSGVIASAASAAPQRRRQIVAINQRPIATRGFIARLLDELLPPQRQHYPAVVLHFQLPSDGIDVNMRAGKEEVGIRAPSAIARLLYCTFRQPLFMPLPTTTPLVAMPPQRLLGYHHTWLVASASDGLTVFCPANIMAHCGITSLPSGALVVPPYPLSPRAQQALSPHIVALAALGMVLQWQAGALVVMRLPANYHQRPLDQCITAMMQTLHHGGTPAMAVGHLIDGDYLIAQLRTHHAPWQGHTSLIIAHYRMLSALRMPRTTEAPDESPLPPPAVSLP